jgi:glycerol-3-phosphate dehydrogenase
VNHVLLPVPTARTKGVLVSPTVFGNVVLGPTADDVDDKRDTASTPDGIARLLDHGRRLVPALVAEEVTAIYAGLRAATEHADYQIAFSPSAGYVCVGGIRSTGLTAAMAIAEYVVEGLRDAGLRREERADWVPVRMPSLGEHAVRPYQSATAIARDPAYGRIVCHCERTTEGEIRDALAAPIPARSPDGLRRRTRALLGRCQGFYCGATVAAMLDAATKRA